ncbi:hypothetical protein TL16_g12643 [Triparma laevis f. inornata]|uniref:Uncharacterized protein n=1 Tax=Triparma laevis f. inornata TaxID=1714386 RepID=A0A9W7BVH0_9STRA|nr:hypothetical protein TL16_g12643 [Triparma laevis f. inornata]
MLNGKSIGDGDFEYAQLLLAAFFSFARNRTDGSNGDENGKDEEGTLAIVSANTSRAKKSVNQFSSIGKTKTSRTSFSAMMSSSKIAPLTDEKSTSLSCLSTPDATSFVKNHNADLEYENKKVQQMDNELQKYTVDEDNSISSALGLIAGMKMEGAIPFKEYKTTFSTHMFLRGYYNLKSGDIYAMSNYTVRGDHGRIAARITNYYPCCENPGFGQTKESDADKKYIEIPNYHSSIYHESYLLPSPLTDRESINNILCKRLSENSVIVTYHPLTTHPKVEEKDGDSVIRGSLQVVFHVTQLDHGVTEVQYGLHINFGGKLPKFVVNGFIIPDTNGVFSAQQAHFANSLGLKDLTKTDSKLLGEILVNQMKAARKRGGWKKRVASTVTTALSEIKDHDAINLAKDLSTIIISNTKASSAVDHWIAQNAALEEFEKEYAWMRAFFIEIAQRNLNKSNFGLKLRLFGGALLSTIDLVTDIYMTTQFFNTDGQEGYGRVNAWLIGVTLFLQIMVAFVQNSKRPSAFALETIAILTGIKPALDAYKVGSVNTSWLLYYLAADMGLYFLYKIVRGDVFLFINLRGTLRGIVALTERIGVKVLASFTLLMQMRYPQEMGGFMFLTSILFALDERFVSVYLHLTYYEEGDTKLDVETLQAILGSLCAIWLTSAVAFASIMKRKYLRTFFSLETASDFNRVKFSTLRDEMTKRRRKAR